MKTIDWDSLTFANNYVFQKYLIERILHIQIKDIRYLIAERHINSARISSKSIRLDVYVENQEGTVLDIEMQVTGDNSTVYSDKDETTVIKGLPLRTRYYQSLISMDMLKQGMKYREVSPTLFLSAPLTRSVKGCRCIISPIGAKRTIRWRWVI